MVNVIIAPEDLWEFFINETGLDKKLVVIAEDISFNKKTEILLTIEEDGATLIVERDGEELTAESINSQNIEKRYTDLIDKYLYEIEPEDEDEQDRIDELYVNYDNAVSATCDLIEMYTGVDILGNMLDDNQGDIVDKLIMGFIEVIKKTLEVDDIFLPGIVDFATGMKEEEEKDE